MATIATHNGSKVMQAHNIRAKSCVEKEPHINPNGVYEVWHHETIKDAYERIFSDAVERYNEKQKRADRKINNYLAEVRADERRHDAYEMIIGVYGDNVSDKNAHNIMREYVDSWRKRNPNLELIGAYYHADEQGKNPHVHIDYIPVAHGYKRGLDTQNGLVKALEEMNIIKSGRETAQIQWERRENQYLENICHNHGLHVEHPQAGKGVKHLEKEAFICDRKLNDKKIELEGLKKSIHVAKNQKLEALRERDSINADKDYLTAVKEAIEAVEGYDEEIEVISRSSSKKKDLFSRQKPATVTIKESDFQQIKDWKKYYRQSVDLVQEFEKIENEYKRYAEIVHQNKIDGYRQNYANDMQNLKRELLRRGDTIQGMNETIEHLQTRIKDLTKEISKIDEKLEEYELLESEYPNQWEEFQKAVKAEHEKQFFEKDRDELEFER